MSEQKKPPQSNSSRTVVIFAVAVLIVVAIAGIVLAGRKAPAPAPEAAVAGTPATPAATPSSGSTPQATGSPTDPLPKDVAFAAGSDKLPAGSNEGLARFADAARSSASSVRLSARFLTGANKERDFELAKARTGAIRHALEANGLGSGKMQVELIEMPDGSLTPDAGNRVDLTLR
jgi:outer membrane protein OmpA-like peptidoglycan-associated protein